MLNLFRKDLLLMGMYQPITVALLIIMPAVTCLLKTEPVDAGPMIILMGIFCMSMMYSMFFRMESAGRGESMMIAIGYGRKQMVAERYLLIWVVYVVCLIIYSVESAVAANLAAPSITDIELSLSVLLICQALTMALTSKFGIRAGYESMFILLLIFVFFPNIMMYFGRWNGQRDAMISGMTSGIFFTALLGASVAISLIVFKLTERSYERKDL